MLATDAHDLLEQLIAERAAHPSAELDDEIAVVEAHWVGLAVTEIAVLRADFDGPLEG